ncbi:sugar ABC transporter substrate-binding protein [Labrys okinawensis]|uniref:Sugar ABC transporter substrate-binding protein n=1 Tax=Labrys okinawensis TaxID=346911 RepID=A0A2S9Q3N2_9HYPH|nr:sugar ABC transporter substrate-binding protein [Labrys okinawensis]PRH83967.1 sugar ABC transporter substrate-binding protein [Labrys okinawensis]
MTFAADRRAFLKSVAALVAAGALPRAALAQTANINYWHHFSSQVEFAGLDAVMKAFAAKHPAVKVTQENIPNPEFMAKVTAAVAADSKPDTSQVTAERVADLTAMGALVDLTDRVNGWSGKTDYPDDRWKGVTRDGKIYGIPSFAFVDWMYYRRDWFEEAGISAPKTFAEFLEAAKKLTDASKNRYGFGLRGGAGGQKYIIDVMEAFGAPLVKDGHIGLDKAPAVEAIKFYAGLFTEHKVAPPSAPNDGYRQIVEAFSTGQTAMLWHHTGSIKDIEKALKPGEQFATATMPAGPSARIARLAYAYNGLMKETNADAAWSWVSFWAEADAALAFLQATGYFPASAKLAQHAAITGNPIYAPAAEVLGYGQLPPSFPGLAGWSEGVALPAFQRVLIGQATAEEAVDEMIAGLEEAK